MSIPVFRKPEHHPKGWGEEVWIASNELYCGKLLCFKKGGKSSAHFHGDKKESWLVFKGAIRLGTVDPVTALWSSRLCDEGTAIDIPRLCVHQVEALEETILIEVSSPDRPEDSLRIAPGDSQK